MVGEIGLVDGALSNVLADLVNTQWVVLRPIPRKTGIVHFQQTG